MSEVDGSLALEWVLQKISAAKAPKAKLVEAPSAKKTEPKKDLSAKKVNELELWKTWKDNGQKPEDLDPLLKSFSGLLFNRINLYKNRVEIPTAAIEHEHKKEFVNALKTYDPSKAALNTHITNRLMKAGRFVETNKNFARIPENISKYIGYFNSTKSELSNQLGFEPNDSMLHDHILKNPIMIKDKPHVFSMKDIKRLNKEQRRGLIHNERDNEDVLGTPNLSSREEEVVHLVYHQLNDQEKLVHEYTFGLNGKPVLGSGEIAKKLNVHVSKVSKLKASIRDQVLAYLG